MQALPMSAIPCLKAGTCSTKASATMSEVEKNHFCLQPLPLAEVFPIHQQWARP
jgi:hypothetical protein